jgi:Cd2+/Zn2+-exporting ATPase
VLYVAAYAFGGFDLVRHWVGSLRRGRLTFDIDLLMLLAALGASLLGEWVEGAFLLFLFSLAHALEHYALGRARGAIRALADLAPPTARVLREEKMVEVPIEEVVLGEVVVVRPAERVPVDGEVHDGRSAVNQAPITGESVPVEKSPGDEVFAGTVNGDGALFVTATRVAGDRTLDRVIALVEEAQTQKAPTQRFTERFERVFVPTILVADLLLIVVPPLLGLWPWAVSFYRGMAMLVAASPCALALGTPSAVLAGIAQAARHGVLIKGGAHLENLGALRAIAFDKTGTLTVGEPRLTDLSPAAGVPDDELLAVTAAVERHSQHPLAEAVVAHADRKGLSQLHAGELESLTARGVRARVAGEVVEVGNLRLWEESGSAIPEEVRSAVATLQAAGHSTMAVRQGGRWLGVIGVADRPREGVREVLQRLRGMGIDTLAMLTGDNRGVGEAIAREVGVNEVRADLLPEDKVAAVRELLREHGQVAMVGDGVNDAPALAHATVGIAMGGAGTAVALETADVALMGDELSKLPFAVGLSRQARGIIRQNLYVSLGVIALLILATTTGFVGIGPAVFIHEGSTLVVIGNALRLLGYQQERSPT